MATMLSVGVMNSFAVTNQHGQQIASASSMVTGKITKIGSHNLTIRDRSGKYHVINLGEPSMLRGLKSGDEVTVAYQNGKATSINKVAGYAPSSGSNKNM